MYIEVKDTDKTELWNSDGSQINVKEFIGYAKEKVLYISSV